MIAMSHHSVSIGAEPPAETVSLALHQQEGKPVGCLFQHGLGADYRQCLEVIPESLSYGFACLDCRAHGASDYGDPSQFSLAAFANDLVQVIEQQMEPPIALGGISMGAALSLRIAARRPDLVRALILARPAWALNAAPSNMQPNLLVGELLTRHSVDEAREIFSNTKTYSQLQRSAPDNLASLLSFFDRPDAAAFGHVLCAISNDGPGIDESLLHNWQTPTVVLATPDDHVHPIELADELAEALNAGPVIQLPAKHNNKAAYQHEFRQQLTDFLDTHTS
jgi:pimeloyl-ACP methyl ester carboxylesterase